MVEEPPETEDTNQKRVVSYEAADRSAICCLGCQAWIFILAGVGFGVWYLFVGEIWRVVVGLILLIGGLALSRYLSTGRNRWEVSFDRDRRVVTLFSSVAGDAEGRVIAYEQIEDVRLREITRDVTDGENVPHQLPVFVLASGEELALDEQLSIRDPERAEEVREEMRELLGLESQQE